MILVDEGLTVAVRARRADAICVLGNPITEMLTLPYCMLMPMRGWGWLVAHVQFCRVGG